MIALINAGIWQAGERAVFLELLQAVCQDGPLFFGVDSAFLEDRDRLSDSTSRDSDAERDALNAGLLLPCSFAADDGSAVSSV